LKRKDKLLEIQANGNVIYREEVWRRLKIRLEFQNEIKLNIF
jgi:hypothetical protein